MALSAQTWPLNRANRQTGAEWRHWLFRSLLVLSIVLVVGGLVYVSANRPPLSAPATSDPAIWIVMALALISIAGLSGLTALLIRERSVKRQARNRAYNRAQTNTSSATATAIRQASTAPTLAPFAPLPEQLPQAALTVLPPGLQALLDMGEQGYWIQDANGQYLRAEPARQQSSSRMRELAGSKRPGSLEKLLREQPGCTSPAEQESHYPAFDGLVWSKPLADGKVLRVRESGRPRFNGDGNFLGFHGTIEDLSLVGTDDSRHKLTIQALAVMPVPTLLVARSRRLREDQDDNNAWQLIWCNHAVGTLAQYEQNDLQKLPLTRWLICSPAGQRMHEARRQRSYGGPELLQLLDKRAYARAAGLVVDRFSEKHSVLVTMEPLSTHEQTELAMIVLDDRLPALARLRAETRRHEEARVAIEKRALETEMATRELESFSHTVSHDLRQPIRQIDGFARILQEDHSELLGRTGRDHINRILNASHRMNAMIDALLQTHRISSSMVVPDPVDLSALAANVAEELQTSQPDVVCDIQIETSLACRGDRVLLRMLLWNLFENAWKYSARANVREIRFDTAMIHDTRVFRVSDNGVGFDKKYADQIFGLFHRLHGNGEFKGNGVGLATVQRIVRRHGGRIWAEGEPGGGASFMFTLWDEKN